DVERVIRSDVRVLPYALPVEEDVDVLTNAALVVEDPAGRLGPRGLQAADDRTDVSPLEPELSVPSGEVLQRCAQYHDGHLGRAYRDPPSRVRDRRRLVLEVHTIRDQELPTPVEPPAFEDLHDAAVHRGRRAVRVLGRVDIDRGSVGVVRGWGGRRPRDRPGRVATGIDVDRSSQPRSLDIGEGPDQCGEQLLVAGDRAEEWDGSR